MRKTLAMTLIAALVLSLVVPTVVFAERGGNKDASSHGKAAAPGQAKKAESEASDGIVERSKSNKPEGAGKPEGDTSKGGSKPEGAGKSADEVHGKGAASKETSGSAEETSGSVEPSGTPHAGKQNAFERITSNIEKSMAKVAAGTKKQIPPGLMKVWLKFAAWLSVTDAPPWETVTPEEPTGTVEPTTTVEPTETVAPGL